MRGSSPNRKPWHYWQCDPVPLLAKIAQNKTCQGGEASGPVSGGRRHDDRRSQSRSLRGEGAVFRLSRQHSADLAAWTGRGERCALVTLVGVDGNAPRAEGAQMAVSESGELGRYISGGCLEQAIALEALQRSRQASPAFCATARAHPISISNCPAAAASTCSSSPSKTRR